MKNILVVVAQQGCSAAVVWLVAPGSQINGHGSLLLIHLSAVLVTAKGLVCVFFWLHTFSKALKVCADQRCKICNGSISETFWPPTISQVPLSSGEK